MLCSHKMVTSSHSPKSTYRKEMEVESNPKRVVISENPVPTIQRLD